MKRVRYPFFTDTYYGHGLRISKVSSRCIGTQSLHYLKCIVWINGVIMNRTISILLLIIMIPMSNTLSAQERGKIIPVRFTQNDTENDEIDPSYRGKWGWHKVHKRTVRKFQKKASLQKKDICSKCHQKNKYKIFDPHNQLNETGDIIREKCLYCHPEKPDEKRATFTIHRPEIKFIRSLDVLCLGCHSKVYDHAHPVNANHICKPSNEMLAMMKASEKEFDIILPLNFKGEIMCATCHNPHERGVIPYEKSAAKGASEKYRVRLAGQTERSEAEGASGNSTFRISGPIFKICITCHKDKVTADLRLR